jgi:protein phosphatase
MSQNKINCWEYMKCGRGPEQGGAICPAASDTAFDGLNEGIKGGRSCWLLAGTACKKKASGRFAKEFETCKRCEFFKQVHGRNDQISLGIKNIDIVACTHTGLVQTANEDRYLVRTMDDNALMLGVADGLGGDVSSDVAAELARGRLAALANLPAGSEAEFLDKFARDLDLFIHQKAEDHPGLTYMATTLVCSVLKEDVIHWVNIGDSRLYVLRDGDLVQITKDQTLAKALVEQGELTPEDAKRHYSQKILDQCLGYGMCEPDTGRFKVKKDDIMVLATDGLYKMAARDVMVNILNGASTLKQKITALMDAALSGGGKDNITIILAHIKQTL